MCGIVGMFSKNQKITQDDLYPMAQAIAHRGPDGEGFYTYQNIGIGHKRLAIIDPNGGHQPMFNEDKTVAITFNGAIYNYLELRQELVQLGHDIKTYCDTEVIIHAYEEFGEKCVERFNGMFSFAILDENKGQVFCARDRMGIKPFYYYHDNENFLFGSEIKALFAPKKFKTEYNEKGIMDYITFQFTLGEKTMFKDVYKLLPGHSLTLSLDTGSINIHKYWDISYEIDNHHTEEYFVDKLTRIIEDSVRLRLRSDVPLGCHLSGGLDSSTVVTIASELLEDAKLKTFTGKFNDGAAYDESKYAKLVSKKTGTEYHEVAPNAEDFKSILEDLIYYMDEPAAGPGIFPQYYVSKLASENVKVALGGQGGDEIFIGYARYLVAYLEECIKGSIFETSDPEKHSVTLDSIIPNLTLLKTYQPMLQNFWKEGLFGEQDERYFRIVDRSASSKIVYDEGFLNGIDYDPFDEFKEIFNKEDAQSYINRMMYFDIKSSLPALLQVEDRTSMSVGLESRLPLMDHRIVELVSSISPSMKFKGGETKALFKEAIKNIVPEEIFNREDKMGFPVPLVKWYDDELKEYIHSILLSDKAKNRGIYNISEIEKAISKEGNFSRVVWGLLCLEIWFRTFIDEE